MLRALLMLTWLSQLGREEKMVAFCSAQPGVPAQATLLESWSGTRQKGRQESRETYFHAA
ncbi:hypothetical protein IG631_06425 [Alternaria alternata]|jgi:hypothetical protein|nr:hypothetical protein IG631_06425 [Alternaria alternata]